MHIKNINQYTDDINVEDTMKTYEDVENLVKIFFESDEFEKNMALEEIIESFKPLIVKLMMKYFKRYDEDLMQDGIVELIQRTVDYDYEHFNKFSAYIKNFMELYFRRIYFSSISKINVTNDELYENDLSQNDVYDIEISSIMENLEEKQSYIIKKNVLENKKLKSVAQELNISYIYAKKIKQQAIQIIKSQL